MTILEARNVGKSFGNRVAISNVNLQVARGEFVSIIGPTGCGKSTFLNCIAGFDVPTSGEIVFNSVKIAGPGRERGVVFQEHALYPWLPVIGNVELGPSLRNIPKAERRERAHDFIRLVGLEGFESYYPHELSGGMRQRVALARALVNEPSLLLMDEPFAALDAMTRTGMQELLLNVCERTGATVLFITHDIEEAILLSDRVVPMSRRPGRFIGDISIPLERPRGYDATATPEFAALKRDLIKTLHVELEEARLVTEPAR